MTPSDSSQPDQLTEIQREYRRRRSRVGKGAGLVVCLFLLTTIAARLAAPRMVLAFLFGSTLLGIFVYIGYLMRVWVCPACKAALWLGGQGTLGGKCLRCGVQLYMPWRSKDGKWTAQ